MIEAEQSLIASMVMNPDCIADVLDMVGPQDFRTKQHKDIVNAIVQLSNDGQTVDIFSVADITDQLGYLTDLASNCHRMNEKAASTIVQRDAIRRTALKNLECAMQAVLAAETVDDQLAALAGVSDGIEVRGVEYETYTELYRDAIFRLNARMLGEVAEGLKTGFGTIDDRLSGLSNSDLMIVAARPSMGKTTYAMNIAENVAEAGGNVLVFSLEMSKAQLIDRSMSSRTMVPFREIKSGKFLDGSNAKLELGSSKVINKYNLTIIDKASINVDHAFNIAKKFNRTRKVDLIIIDYLQLMTAKSSNRFEEISTISRTLKAMAKTLDVPVIALSQLSREVEKRTNKRPVNSDLRESGQIEQDADIIQFLYRDEIYNSEDNNPNKGFCEVITSKFRNGEIGTDYLETRLDCCRMLSTSNFPQAQAQENSGGYIPYKR
jgi:replicative DNA helicase